MKKEIIVVKGMSCEHCSNAIKKALKSLGGVQDVIVDLRTGTVEVDFDEKSVNINDLKKAIADEGYGIIDENNRRCWSC